MILYSPYYSRQHLYLDPSINGAAPNQKPPTALSVHIIVIVYSLLPLAGDTAITQTQYISYISHSVHRSVFIPIFIFRGLDRSQIFLATFSLPNSLIF